MGAHQRTRAYFGLLQLQSRAHTTSPFREGVIPPLPAAVAAVRPLPPLPAAVAAVRPPERRRLGRRRPHWLRSRDTTAGRSLAMPNTHKLLSHCRIHAEAAACAGGAADSLAQHGDSTTAWDPSPSKPVVGVGQVGVCKGLPDGRDWPGAWSEERRVNIPTGGPNHPPPRRGAGHLTCTAVHTRGTAGRSGAVGSDRTGRVEVERRGSRPACEPAGRAGYRPEEVAGHWDARPALARQCQRQNGGERRCSQQQNISPIGDVGVV